MLTFCDASFANLHNGGSPGGIIVFLGDGNGNILPLSWSSRRLKRLVRSTLAAETLILVEGAETSFWLTRFINEISNADVPIVCHTDNHSLFEAAYSNKTMEDKRLQVDIAIVCEMVQRKEVSVKWIEWKYQLADSLTKRDIDSSKLLYVSVNSKPDHSPQAIFLMGEFPTLWAKKEFKTPTPGAFLSIIHHKNMKK